MITVAVTAVFRPEKKVQIPIISSLHLIKCTKETVQLHKVKQTDTSKENTQGEVEGIKGCLLFS